MSSLLDKYLKSLEDAYNSRVEHVFGSTPVADTTPEKVETKEAPKLPETKSKSSVTWKGSQNMPYDPDVDDIEDWRHR